MIDRQVRKTIVRLGSSGLILAGLATAGAMAMGASSPGGAAAVRMVEAPLPGGKLGFVVTYFFYAMYQGDDACPQGLQHIATSEEFLTRFPPAERARLLRPENARELDIKMVQRGPNGENVCSNPEAVADPQMLTLAGSRNNGLDLDGQTNDRATTDYTCAHKQYTGEDGRRGVDNQLGRAYACLTGYREKGTLVPYFTTAMRDGMWSMLIELNGVDDRRNDPAITIDVYAGVDPMAKDSKGEVLSGASLSPTTDPKLHRQFQGRIVNGVVETLPDMGTLVIPALQAKRLPPTRIDRPKLELTLLDNGNAKGYLGGYIATKNFSMVGGTGAGEQQTGVPCDGIYYALRKFADGGRDPATGACQTISTSFRIEATPAFIVRPSERQVPTFTRRD
jgi:hypothetical protein